MKNLNSRKPIKFFIATLIIVLGGCALGNKRLAGQGVSTHSLGEGKVELRMKISSLTSNLWITLELANNSVDKLTTDPVSLIEFENPECFETRAKTENNPGPLQPQEIRQFRYSFFWKGRQKNDALYQTCLEKPMRFTLKGMVLADQPLKAPSWTIQ